MGDPTRTCGRPSLVTFPSVGERHMTYLLNTNQATSSRLTSPEMENTQQNVPNCVPTLARRRAIHTYFHVAGYVHINHSPEQAGDTF